MVLHLRLIDENSHFWSKTNQDELRGPTTKEDPRNPHANWTAATRILRCGTRRTRCCPGPHRGARQPARDAAQEALGFPDRRDPEDAQEDGPGAHGVHRRGGPDRGTRAAH
jgi:hypothetical protein